MKCIICAQTAVRYSETSFFKKPVYHCKSCDLYVSEDDPSIYDGKYWDSRAAVESINSSYTDERSVYRRYMLESQLAYCKEFIKGIKVIEIGAGTGSSLYFMEQRGFEVTGIEPDAHIVELINTKLKKGKCVVGYAEEVHFSEQYDIVWLSHVFEHVQKPLQLLRKLSYHCRDFVFIEVPNAENPDFLSASIYKNPSSYHYSLRSLRLLAKKVGVGILKLDHIRYTTKFERRIYNRLGFIGKSIVPYYPYAVGKPSESEAIRAILRPL